MQAQSLYEQLAKMVINHRKAAGLSQLQLAELADVGKTAIFDIEHAKPTIRFNILLKVLDVLNIKITLSSPLEKYTDE